MGIRQQKRPYAPHPEVQSTDYGAKFIKAVTETPAGTVALEQVVDEPSVTEDAPVVEAPVVEAPVVTEPTPQVEEEVKVEQPEKPAARKGKGGRPKKK